MHQFAFKDETFDINQSSTYILTIQAGEEGVVYCIFDTVRNKYIVLTNHPLEKDLSKEVYFEKIEEILQNNELFHNKYKSVNFIIINRKTTLLPSALFQQDQLKTIMDFNTEIDDLDEIHYNHIEYIDAYNIFTVPNRLANEIVEKFSRVNFYHQATPLLENIPKMIASNKKTKVFVNIYRSMFDIAVVRDGAFILYNNFKYSNENDLAYYILHVYKQLKLDPLIHELMVSGEMPKQSAYAKNLNTFIENMIYREPDDNYLYSYTFKKTDTYYFTNLFNLMNCV
ncbi:MAG: DUF3822 family protein [Bacteroidota bacterium]